jgi:hypothetical protein
MPSQLEKKKSRKLYFQFMKIQSEPAVSDTVQSLLDDIRSCQADAAEKILRDVLMHVQTHDGKLPSQLDADSRLLYLQFWKIQRRPSISDTAQSLLDEIRSAQGRGVTAGQADAAEKILRDVLRYVQTHGGKMPSRSEADSRKLYNQFVQIKSKPAASDTAQSLLDEIRSAKVRGVTAGQADAAEKIFLDVLEYMRTHDGKMPSQLEADSRLLYFQFRTIQRRPAFSDTAQSLLDEIRAAKGRRGVTAGQARTKRCRKEAEKQTQELGLTRFLHAE